MCEFYLAVLLLKGVHNRVEIMQYFGVCLFLCPLQHNEPWVIPIGCTGSPLSIVSSLSVLLVPLGGATERCQGIPVVYFGPDWPLADYFLWKLLCLQPRRQVSFPKNPGTQIYLACQPLTCPWLVCLCVFGGEAEGSSQPLTPKWRMWGFGLLTEEKEKK